MNVFFSIQPLGTTSMVVCMLIEGETCIQLSKKHLTIPTPLSQMMMSLKTWALMILSWLNVGLRVII